MGVIVVLAALRQSYSFQCYSHTLCVQSACKINISFTRHARIIVEIVDFQLDPLSMIRDNQIQGWVKSTRNHRRMWHQWWAILQLLGQHWTNVIVTFSCIYISTSPSKNNAVIMLAHCLRRLLINKTALAQRLQLAHYKPFWRGTDLRRQNMTSRDVNYDV